MWCVRVKVFFWEFFGRGKCMLSALMFWSFCSRDLIFGYAVVLNYYMHCLTYFTYRSGLFLLFFFFFVLRNTGFWDTYSSVCWPSYKTASILILYIILYVICILFQLVCTENMIQLHVWQWNSSIWVSIQIYPHYKKKNEATKRKEQCSSCCLIFINSWNKQQETYKLLLISLLKKIDKRCFCIYCLRLICTTGKINWLRDESGHFWFKDVFNSVFILQ